WAPQNVSHWACLFSYWKYYKRAEVFRSWIADQRAAAGVAVSSFLLKRVGLGTPYPNVVDRVREVGARPALADWCSDRGRRTGAGYAMVAYHTHHCSSLRLILWSVSRIVAALRPHRKHGTTTPGSSPILRFESQSAIDSSAVREEWSW